MIYFAGPESSDHFLLFSGINATMQELSSSAEELSSLVGDIKVVIDEFILDSRPKSSIKVVVPQECCYIYKYIYIFNGYIFI